MPAGTAPAYSLLRSHTQAALPSFSARPRCPSLPRWHSPAAPGAEAEHLSTPPPAQEEGNRVTVYLAAFLTTTRQLFWQREAFTSSMEHCKPKRLWDTLAMLPYFVQNPYVVCQCFVKANTLLISSNRELKF